MPSKPSAAACEAARLKLESERAIFLALMCGGHIRILQMHGLKLTADAIAFAGGQEYTDLLVRLSIRFKQLVDGGANLGGAIDALIDEGWPQRLQMPGQAVTKASPVTTH